MRDFLQKISQVNLSSRAEFGHWDGDTIELVRGQSYLVTLVERKARFLVTKLIPNKKSKNVRSAILSAFESFPQAVKSITLDNGTEYHRKLLECTGVFCSSALSLGG